VRFAGVHSYGVGNNSERDSKAGNTGVGCASKGSSSYGAKLSQAETGLLTVQTVRFESLCCTKLSILNCLFLRPNRIDIVLPQAERIVRTTSISAETLSLNLMDCSTSINVHASYCANRLASLGAHALHFTRSALHFEALAYPRRYFLVSSIPHGQSALESPLRLSHC
jgi:hypothetical protein